MIPRDRSRLLGRRALASERELLQFYSKKASQTLSFSCFPSLPRVPSSLSPLPSLPPSSSLPLLLSPLSSIFLALLLRVPSFPRKAQQCLPILAWIRTGPPGTSTVSMPKSWLWVIVVSLFFSSLFGNPPSLTNKLSPLPSPPLTRRWQDQPLTKIHSKQV